MNKNNLNPVLKHAAKIGADYVSIHYTPGKGYTAVYYLGGVHLESWTVGAVDVVCGNATPNEAALSQGAWKQETQAMSDFINDLRGENAKSGQAAKSKKRSSR